MRYILHLLFTIVLLALIILKCIAQKDLVFTHLTTNNGLSQSTVQCMLKDHKGFMWFGTRDGLNKYDGYTFTVFKHDPSNDGSISNNFINDIFEDSNHNLWISTRSGLNKFDRGKNTFIRYNKDSTQLHWVNLTIEDNAGRLWVGSKSGLALFNPESGRCKFYKHNPNDPNSLINDGVYKIVLERNGDILLATPYGLDRFNPKTGIFRHYQEDLSNVKNHIIDYCSTIHIDKKNNLWVWTNDGILKLYDRKNDTFIDLSNLFITSNIPDRQVILSISDGPKGQLWMGTENEGLIIYDYNNKKFTIHKNDLNDEFSLANNAVRCVYKDDIDNMWVGTYSGGVDLFSKSGRKFQQFKSTSSVGKGLNNNIVKSVLEDVDGGLWIGTDGGGINYFNRASNTSKFYLRDDNNPNSPGSNFNHCMIEINKDTLAFGYHRGGFDLFNRKTGKFTNFSREPDPHGSLSDNTVSSLHKDKKGNLWIGTWAGGLNFLAPKSDKFKVYKHSDDPNSLNSDLVYSIMEDKEGNIWIATEFSVELYDKKTDGFKHYLCDTAKSVRIYSTLIDKKNNFWVATQGGGLNLLNRATGKFIKYTEEDGLPNNNVNGMLEDSKGNLWLSTNKGLSKFNPETKSFRNFGIEDGVLGNEFKRNACFKNKKGEMFFGSVNGLNIFYPDSVRDNPFLPPVVFTGFQIFNKPVKIGEQDSLLKKDISETKEITLSYDQSVITFQFAALNFTLPEKNQYAYMLKGFDKDWNYVGRERKATYTNLDPGKYTFMVKASNNDGVWNEKGISMEIIITPPYWKTWWFRILVIITFMGSFISWYKIRINIIERQKKLLEEQVKERTAEILLQKEEIKDSIRAAEVIQKSILPQDEVIKRYLPESFILYQPKDVVSGDFYWLDIKDNKILIAAIDCTGHGVSGALMSINAYHLLKEAIHASHTLIASEILDLLNKSVIEDLNEEDLKSKMDGGMDIALCIIDKNKNTFQYAGANNPLYIVREKELLQVKADRFGIGQKVAGQIKNFTNHNIDIKMGDRFYIFSDGYADQLGGTSKTEKFMYSRFRELLLNIKDKPMNEQLISLDENLKTWRGESEQLDDILVISFKIN